MRVLYSERFRRSYQSAPPAIQRVFAREHVYYGGGAHGHPVHRRRMWLIPDEAAMLWRDSTALTSPLT
jgi:hypothetical protein